MANRFFQPKTAFFAVEFLRSGLDLGDRPPRLVITHIYFLLDSLFLILGTSRLVAAIRARSFPNPACHRDAVPGTRPTAPLPPTRCDGSNRSEEHTTELQS